MNMPTTADLVSLRGRRAVITGAARGLGYATARRLLDAGAAVLIADVDGDLAGHAAEELRSIAEGPVVGMYADVTNAASVAVLAERAVSELGSVDIWVNNAGIMPTAGPFMDADEVLEARILAVNIEGTIRGARHAARHMKPGGVIVNLASSSAFRAGLGVAAYASSKAAVVALTRNLALELGDRGIRVIAVAPHVVDTPGTRAEVDALARAGVSLEKVRRANPLRITLAGDHIARVVLFAVSDLAAGMSGSTLLVDAGALA
jgi:NAD(P)-dependent dehydrogenase (short-subunit alcohol dehydrogenase family)